MTARLLWGWSLSIGLLLVLLWLLKSILFPFLVAFLLAYTFDPLVGRISRFLPRSLSILLLLLAILLVLALFLLFVIPAVENESSQALQRLPGYLDRFRVEILPSVEQNFHVHVPRTFDEVLKALLPKGKEAFPGLFSSLSDGVLRFFSNTLGLIRGLVSLFLIPVATFYFLSDFNKIKEGTIALVPARYQREFRRIAGEIDVALSGFIRGQLLIVLCLMLLYSLSLWMVGIDLAVVLGMIIGLVGLVPYGDLVVGLAITLPLSLVQFQDYLHPLLVLACFGGIQMINGFGLTPKIIGSQAGLHPLWVTGSLVVGGDLFGLPGLLLAVPVSTVLLVSLRALARAYKGSSWFSSPAG